MSFIRSYELNKSIPLYGFRLLQGIQELHIKDVFLLVNDDLQLFFQENYPQFHTVPIRISSFWRKINWRFQDWLYDIIYRWKILCTSYDVVLTINEYTFRTTFRTRKKKVSVIHDLKDLSIQKDSNLSRSRNFYRKLIENADRVVAISEYTKHNILSHYNVSADKIKVIHNCIQLAEVSRRPKVIMDGIKYILYVNTLLEYKNPQTLLRAFNVIKDDIEEHLILVGKVTEYWQDVLLPFIKRNSLEHRVIRLQDLSDEELRYLYEHASVFVTSSLHEGFGYTPIEAAICCCPVICTKSEAIPETTMMLLNYYEPAGDYYELGKKITEVINSPRNNDSLLAISEKFRQKYSPKIQASQFFSLMGNLFQDN